MIRKIFIIHHTHLDIGYTDQAEEVMNQQRTFLDRAIEECRHSDEFRWTIESAYLLKDYLDNRPREAAEELFGCLRDGRMELTGFEFQSLLELCSREELDRVFAYAVQCGKEHRFPVTCAMLDDIGGWPAALPDLCRRSGIRYLIAGAGAFQVFLPWTPELPHLFWHRGPDGGRVLVWNLGIDRRKTPQESHNLLAVYGMAADFIINPWKHFFRREAGGDSNGIAHRRELSPRDCYAELEERLTGEQYPYEELMLQYGGDNRWPDKDLPYLIRKINASGELPPIELTTPSRFMSLMEERYADAIPEFSGMLADPWVIRTNPAASALKNYRSAQRDFRLANRLKGYCDSRENEILLQKSADYLALYSDHTCGLSTWHTPSVRIPGIGTGMREFLPLRQSWRTKSFYADSADCLARSIARRIIGHSLLRRNGKNIWLVWNPSREKQGGFVEFHTGRDQGKLSTVTTPQGENLRFEEIAYHRYLIELPVMAPDEILPIHYELETDIIDLISSPLPQAGPLPCSWENDFFHLQFASDGTIELFAGKNREIFFRRNQGGCGFLEPLLELPQAYSLEWDAAGMFPLAESAFPPVQWESAVLLRHGILSDVVERRGRFPGRCEFTLLWRLYHHLARIDVELALCKPEALELSALYLGVPLSGEADQWILYTADRAVDLQKELLPGAMRDAFYAHRGISCRAAGTIWTMFSPDAPVVHPGSIRNFKWDSSRNFKNEQAGFYWQIHHNMLITDSPAFQQINDAFRFSLRMGNPGPVEDPQEFTA